MKICVFACIGLVFTVCAASQTPAVEEPTSPLAQRERIAWQRKEIMERMAIQEQECASKFAVNACLQEVKARHREPLADLRRQEVSLNDAERRRKAVEQLKSTQRKHSEAEDKAAGMNASRLEQERRSAAKAQESLQADQAAQRNRQKSAQKQQESTQLEIERSQAALLASENHRLQELKKAEAAKHRAKVQQRLDEHAATRAQPLPVPPP